MSVYTSGRGESLRRRGVVAPLVLVTLFVALGFVALSVDVGHVYNSRTDMQNAVDSSALAGASGLPNGEQVVRARAAAYAGRNAVAGTFVSPQELTVVIGNWEGSRKQFYSSTGNEIVSPNAVRVVGTRTELPLFFAPILGVDTSSIERGATATVGSGRCAGVWGLDAIAGAGNLLTDSYDSRDGAYGPGNIHPNGDICSNRNIDLAGSVEIFGDVMYGDGYSLTASGNAFSVWGTLDHHCCTEVPPAFDINGAEGSNDNAVIGLTDRGRDPFQGTQWDLHVTGNDNLTLTGGTYYFTSFVLDGRATITVTGPTIIYLSGPAELTGAGIINVTQDPSNLLIYSTGSSLLLDGTAGFYGAVIAPEADIQLVGTGDYYGIIMGRTLNIEGNANVHVDESLIAQLFGGNSIAPALVE